MNFIKKFFQKISIIYYQIGFTLVSLILIVVICGKKHNKTIITDPTPKIHHITPKETKDLYKEIVKIKTGLFIRNFPKFDIKNSSFIIDAVVWFEFPHYAIPLSTIEDFSFEKATILQKEKSKTKVIDNKQVVYYEVRISFSSDLNFKQFPFDDHRIFLILENKKILYTEAIFESDQTVLITPTKTNIKEWVIIDKSVDYGYIVPFPKQKTKTTDLNYPAVAFSLDFIGFGIKKILIIFLPLYLIFFLGLFALLLKSSAAIRSSMTTVGALVFYRFIIEKITPLVGHLTISDKLYLTILAMQFLVFLTIITASFFEKKYGNHKKIVSRLSLIKNALFFLLLIMIVALTYFFLKL